MLVSGSRRQALVEEAPALPIVPACSRRQAVVRGLLRYRRRLGAVVGGRRQQRSAAAAAFRLRPLLPATAAASGPPQPQARSKSGRQGSSSIVHSPRRQQAACIDGQLRFGCRRRPLSVAGCGVGRQRLAAAEACQALVRQRSAAMSPVTCLAQPGPWQ